MFSVQRTKLRMRAYMRVHGLTVPNMNYASPIWGNGARKAAWRVTGHLRKHKWKYPQTDLKTDALCIALGMQPPLRIIKPAYGSWNGYPVKRFGPPKGVAWHHEGHFDGVYNDSLSDVLQIHRYHRDSLKWRGIAYHLFIGKDGKVYQGRPLDTIGGHAASAGEWIGVALEGNYDKPGEAMPAAQLRSAKLVHQFLERKYGRSLIDKRHCDLPNNSTACPGRSFPFAAITSLH